MDSQSSSAFYRLNGRLALYRDIPEHQEHWEERWESGDLSKLLDQHRNGHLGEFEGIFTRHLPKDKPVLEAGCGLGQLVMALRARGYAAEGVDYAARTIARIQSVASDLPVRTGDVYNLGVPEGTYGGYISIGLFEHNLAGPAAGLREAHRVLHCDGVALISVPYMNVVRSWRIARLSGIQGELSPEGYRFYQFYFSEAEFRALLAESGFEVIETLPYAVYSGVTRDTRIGSWLYQRGFLHWRLHRLVRRILASTPRWFSSRYGHMMMYACKKAGSEPAAAT